MINDADRERLAGKTVVVSLSGGKDSTATDLHLREHGINTIRVNMDTGWELYWDGREPWCPKCRRMR